MSMATYQNEHLLGFNSLCAGGGTVANGNVSPPSVAPSDGAFVTLMASGNGDGSGGVSGVSSAASLTSSRCASAIGAGVTTVLTPNSHFVSVAPPVLLSGNTVAHGIFGATHFHATTVPQTLYDQAMSRTVSAPNLGTAAAGHQNLYVVQQNHFPNHIQPTTTTMYDSGAISSVNFLNIPLREDYTSVSELVERKPEPIEIPPPSTSGAAEEEEPEQEGEIDIQIRNVVCNYTLPLHIDLHRVALHSGNVTFDRGRGVLLKQKRNPSCYVKVYSSGKIYIVGCRSESECKRAARGVARMVQKQMGRLGDVVRIRNYRVCNVLATCKMPFGIKIEELAQKYPDRSQYEPELSVGLVWRSTDPKATLRIHTTGSITVTGAVSEDDVMRAIELIYPIVKEFRCAQRHKDTTASAKRKAARKASGGPLPKRATKSIYSNCASSGRPETSGVIGNRVYFSDEDDELYDNDDY